MTAADVIPPITSKLGQYWKQPERCEILLDETHAVMTQESFARLLEYSETVPTGVYEGKMWKRHECRRWLLVWYGRSSDPEMCAISYREILVV